MKDYKEAPPINTSDGLIKGSTTSPTPLTEKQEMERIVERDADKILKLLNAGVPYGTMNLQKEKLKDRLRTTYTALEDGYKKQLAEQVRRKQEAISTLTTQHTKEKEEIMEAYHNGIKKIASELRNAGLTKTADTIDHDVEILKKSLKHNITI